MSTFDIDIGAHLLEQSSGNENLAAAITLGLGVRQKRFESDIPKPPIVIKRDETDVCPACGGLVGIVPRCHLQPPPCVPLPPDRAMREGCFRNQSFLHTPAI